MSSSKEIIFWLDIKTFCLLAKLEVQSDVILSLVSLFSRIVSNLSAPHCFYVWVSFWSTFKHECTTLFSKEHWHQGNLLWDSMVDQVFCCIVT